MDHVAPAHIEGPVLVADVENLNQVSRIVFTTELQEKTPEGYRQIFRSSKGPARRPRLAWGPLAGAHHLVRVYGAPTCAGQETEAQGGGRECTKHLAGKQLHLVLSATHPPVLCVPASLPFDIAFLCPNVLPRE